MRIPDKFPAVIAGLLTFGYFLYMAGPGLFAPFSPDDMMNLYFAWSAPALKLVEANLLVFTSAYRPLGALWYRAVYSAAGFQPLAFHAVAFAVLAANLLLAYAAARRLTGSREAGAVAALLLSYHARLSGLYYDTGNIYDILAFFFYFAAILWYVRLRQGGRAPGAAGLAVLAILYALALNAKEIAVTLPPVLLMYELVYHWPRGRRLRDLVHQAGGVLLTGAMTAAFILAKASSLTANPAYAPVLTLQRFLETSRNYLNIIFYQNGWFTDTTVVVLWAGMLAAAWWSRSKPLWFAAVFVILAPLPVNFILYRGGSAIYIAMFGWALYPAVLISAGTDWLLHRWQPKPGQWVRQAKTAAVLLGVVALLHPVHRRAQPFEVEIATMGGRSIQPVIEQMRARHPKMPRGARVLFLDDPFEKDDWQLTFILRLLYSDPSLEVTRVKQMEGGLKPEQMAGFRHVFAFREGRLTETRIP